jgi:two-component system phosphate regulon response regulator PhoB
MTKILIAEDDEEIRSLLQFKLETAGFEVRGVPDGEAAVEMAQSMLPDLVLLDWMLPRMNGLETCVALRKIPEFRSLPIVMLTAKTQEIDVDRGFAAGVDDYIVKPFSPREVTRRIEALLARTRSSSIEAFIARTHE